VDVPLDDIIPAEYRREAIPRLPELSELDVMRHYIKLSHKNHFIGKRPLPIGQLHDEIQSQGP
jgi:glycine dehydrogenase subunit 2